MRQPYRPAKRAHQMAEAVYTRVITSPADYLGKSSPEELDRRVMVYVEGLDPTIPLDEQIRGNADQTSVARPDALKSNARLWRELVDLLRRGASANEAQVFLAGRQRWDCFAVVDCRTNLQSEFASRYRHGPCEVDFGSAEMDGRLLLICRMLPQMWRP